MLMEPRAGGQISLTSLVGDINVGSGGDAIPLSAQALSSGNGGTISLTSAGDLNLNPADFSVNALNDSNGGILSFTAGQMFTTSGTYQANGQGSGTGGSLSVNASDFTFSDVTEMNLIGGDSGNGGTATLTQTNASTDLADFSNLSVFVDGGASDESGGNCSFTYAAVALNIGTISATSTVEGDGGAVNITSTSNVDLVVSILGSLNTNGEADYDGSITFAPFDSSNNSLDLTIGEEADFETVLNVTAMSVSLTAESNTVLNVNHLVSVNGDINLSLPPPDEGELASPNLETVPVASSVHLIPSGTINPSRGNLTISAPWGAN